MKLPRGFALRSRLYRIASREYDAESLTIGYSTSRLDKYDYKYKPTNFYALPYEEQERRITEIYNREDV